jgi:hypothetical protein
MNKAIVITTINPPKKEIYEWAKYNDWLLISAGDLKTPTNWYAENVLYLSPKMQDKLFPDFSKVFPWNMPARKNLAYLSAMKNGAELIYETDDDMLPYANFPPKIDKYTKATVLSNKKFINVFNFFRDKKDKEPIAWLRGFPLDYINNQTNIKQRESKIYCPIINSLQDDDCDFDAVYRLLFNKRLAFKKTGSYAIEKGSYAPINTQSTFHFPEVFPLLYLPATSGFHTEDIIQGYIAQRIIWEMGARVLFIPPVARTSNRNIHNLWKDFEFELPLFLKTNKLISILDSLSLFKDPLKSLLKVYKELVKQNYFPKEEMKMVEAWAKEIEKLRNISKSTIK